MIENFRQDYIEWLAGTGMRAESAVLFKTLSFLLVLILLSIFINWITRFLIVTVEKYIVRRTRVTWDDSFVKNKVFNRLSHFAPALLIYFTAQLVFGEYPKTAVAVERISYAYMIFSVSLFLASLLNALHDIYLTLPGSESKPIKGYIQIGKITVYIIFSLLVVSVLFKVDMQGIFTGLGAFAAVLILVFKDTILGFVAGVQISANKMVKPGDWIEIPPRGVDGTVVDISINTVKVRNFDNTIVTVPTYALVSESFQNWKGMEESGGRRIKRSLFIDMNSVKFCSPDMLDKFRKIHYLKEYIQAREKEIEEYNRTNDIDDTVLVNGRRMTNLGTFRAYITNYLKNNPNVHKDMTLMVRHRQPSENGLPLEVYVFSNDPRWVYYETIQSDIFDHLLAVVGEFELKVFQHPTGSDFRLFGEGKQT